MKYHNHIIKKVYADLGEEKESLNCVYNIYKDNEKLVEALTISTAKKYIDNDYNEDYL